jgi:hypothetical protein
VMPACTIYLSMMIAGMGSRFLNRQLRVKDENPTA